MKRELNEIDFVEEFQDCTEVLDMELPEYTGVEFNEPKSLVVDTRPNTLSFLDEDELYVLEEEWQGMPEFENEAEKFHHTVLVKLETEADLKAFEELLGRSINERTRSIHFPKREQKTSIDMYFVEDK